MLNHLSPIKGRRLKNKENIHPRCFSPVLSQKSTLKNDETNQNLKIDQNIQTDTIYSLFVNSEEKPTYSRSKNNICVLDMCLDDAIKQD